MLYSVRLMDNPHHEIRVEAAEFHQLGAGVSFFAERMVNRDGNDQWGNPRRNRQRVAVAYFNNVQSILEIPQEDPGVPEVAMEQGVPFDFEAGIAAPPHEWTVNRLGTNEGQVDSRRVGRRGVGATEPMADIPVAQAMDDDGIAWDAERDE